MATSLDWASDANPYIAQLVKVLQDNLQRDCGLRVSEIVKAGSLGQGTAIPGDFDLDIVVYSQDISKEIMCSPPSLKAILDRINTMLDEHLGDDRYKDVELTDHAVRFSFDGRLEVDLLPSPFWRTSDTFYEDLKTVDARKRRMFSCTAAKWQKEFILGQPQQARDYIRKVKAWRNEKWPRKEDGVGRPKSYLISLLVIKAYEESNGSKESVKTKLKNLVTNHSRLHVHWTNRGALYSDKFVGYFPSWPYIIDPANPYNNVYVTGIGKYEGGCPEGSYEPGDGNWTRFVRVIETLQL